MKNNGLPNLGRKIDLAIEVGVAKAISEHKAAGRSIAVWKDGKVVIVPPEEIKVRRTRQLKVKQ